VVLPDDIFQFRGSQAVREWPGGLLVEERQGRFDRFHRTLGRWRDVCGLASVAGTPTIEGSAADGMEPVTGLAHRAARVLPS
jgi:hypothetical protein